MTYRHVVPWLCISEAVANARFVVDVTRPVGTGGIVFQFFAEGVDVDANIMLRIGAGWTQIIFWALVFVTVSTMFSIASMILRRCLSQHTPIFILSLPIRRLSLIRTATQPIRRISGMSSVYIRPICIKKDMSINYSI